ncbi:MAG: SGNH/GDSL hydrolase family protein [Chthoniobacteraceae bacterium]|nr:SGNH/GDSL hydrolase family protein [Chthoniobacteraceae bacterium]
MKPGLLLLVFSAAAVFAQASPPPETAQRPSASPAAVIDADNPAIQYFGRFSFANPKAPESGWPATSVRARFEGTSIRARLASDGTGALAPFYAILDGREDDPVVLGGDKRGEWLIAKGLPDTVHTIELVRLGNAWNAPSRFQGFLLDAGKKLAEPPPRPARRIEFYGDSITEGSYMAGQPFANPYRAYAATTARLLHAEVSLVCKGGMGLVRGFTMPPLPAVYDRTEPARADMPWGFSHWTPHVVVVNIGQNDSWKGTEPAPYIDAYAKFLAALRGHYPNALIVCALGSMDAVAPGSKWPGHIRAAVEQAKKETQDPRIETFFFEYLGKKGHPDPAQARAMAEKLAAFLEAKGPALWTSPPSPKI